MAMAPAIERRFIVFGAVAILGAAIAYVVLIHTMLGQEIENLALRGARQAVPEIRDSSLLELSEVSLSAFAAAIGIVMTIALLRRKVLLAFTVAAVMGISVLIAELAKRTLSRPELVDAPPGWLNNSFPSGHVAVAVAIGIGAILVLPYSLRWIGAAGGALYAIDIGLAVETAGWHRLSGVVGATLLVLAVAAAGMYVLARLGRVRRFQSRRLVGALLATALLGAGAVAFGGASAIGVARLLPIPLDPTRGDMSLAYATTLLSGTAVIAIAFLAFLWLVRPFSVDEELPGAEAVADEPTLR